MKDAVRCKIIDAMMMGYEIEVTVNHIWNCWSLTHGHPAITPLYIFSWRHDSIPPMTEELTLKEALAIIDKYWDDRIVTDTNEWWNRAV